MQKNSFLWTTKLAVGILAITPFITFAQFDNAEALKKERELQGELLKQRMENQREVSKKILEAKKEALQQNQEDREELRKASIERIKSVQNEIRIQRESLKDEIKDLSRDEVKKQLEEFRKESQKKREEMHKEIKNEREEFKKKADERKDELKKKIGGERAKLVEGYFTQMVNRMDAAVDRLDKLADRVESRLNKIHDAGKDITEPQAALDTARIAIVGVQTAISDAKAKFAALSASSTPQEQFSAVKSIISVVKTKSKEAHAALVEVINSIKKGRLDVGEATSTPNTQ